MLRKTITLIFVILILISNTETIESRISKKEPFDSCSSFHMVNEERLTRVKERACRQGWFKKDRYQIHIVDNKEPNAICYPNAVILINSGLMNAIKSDEELELILYLLIIESSC